MKTALVNTPLGIMELKGDKNGLTSAIFKEENNLDISETSQEFPQELKEAVMQLKNYFAGKITHFDLKLNPQGTEFQQRVWEKLSTISYGKTCSYLKIAKLLGDPKVIRAAASANGKNPICIIIPCHRVVGSDHSLTGYAGGLWRKKWLLEHESPVRQTSLF